MKAKKLTILLLLALPWCFGSWAQTASNYIAEGRSYLASSNLAAANLSFSNALVLSPADPTGNAFYAATRLLVLPSQPVGSNFLTRWGVPAAGRNLYDWTATPPEDTNGVPLAPAGVNADEATSLLRTNILDQIIAADANLALITNTNFTLQLSAQETASTAVTIDYGDIQLLRSMLEAGEYFIYNTYSWNLNAQMTVVRSFYSDGTYSVDGLLSESPGLLTFASTNDLGNAEGAFVNAAHQYLAASQFIRNRPPGTIRLFNLDSRDDGREQKFRLTISDLAGSLTNGLTTLQANSNYAVFMPAAFAGTHSVRSMLPKIHGNGFVVGSWPDPSFGGVITGVSSGALDSFLSERFVAIPDILPPVGPGIQLPIHVIAGHGYVVQASVDLVNWSNAAAFVAADNSYLYTDPAGLSQPRRFYRAVDATANMPPPANDDFANRTPLTGLGIQTTGYIENASVENNEPGNGYPSIWWSWTAPSTGLVVVSTAGSSASAGVSVYTGTTLDNLNLVNEVQVNNTSYNGYAFMASAGATYQIQVSGFGFVFGTPGAIKLEIGPPPVLTVTSPVDGSMIRTPTNIVITASAAAPDGITGLQYYVSEQYYPYTYLNGATNGSSLDVTLTNVDQNTYSISETASDNLGISISRYQTVTVNGLVVNGDFETGDFTGWTLSGDTSDTYVDYFGFQSGIYPFSGYYDAALRTGSSPGFLSQTVPTVAGNNYSISFWFANFFGDPGKFAVFWNGSILYVNNDTAGLANNSWTNMQFTVPATSANTVLQFEFQDNENNLGLDDITVTTAP